MGVSLFGTLKDFFFQPYLSFLPYVVCFCGNILNKNKFGHIKLKRGENLGDFL